MDKQELVKSLIKVDVKAELILNRFKEVGLMVEPDGNPNSISTLLYDIQTDLNTLMCEILGISLDDDTMREKYYQSTRKVKSVKNMEAVVNKASEVLLENKED